MYKPVLSLLLLLVSATALAQWSNNAALNNAICAAVGEQSNPTMVSDGQGGAIIAWQDYRGGIVADIYAQRINSYGLVQWGASGVVIATGNDKRVPSIVNDGAGGAIITWEDYRIGTDIYAQRVNANGVVQWTINGVAVCTAFGIQTRPKIVADGSGGAIIAWQDFRNGNYDIYAQRINGTGTVQWSTNGVAVSTASGDQTSQEMVSDGAGGAIMAWRDFRSGVFNYIYAQRLNSNGIAQFATDGELISDGNSQEPAIVNDGLGGAFIAWQGASAGVGGIFARKISHVGSLLQQTLVAVPNSFFTNLQKPAIASDGLFGAIIAWRATAGAHRVLAQRINPLGVRQWDTSGVVLGYTGSTLRGPRIISDGAGGAIITYDHESFVQRDIIAHRINAFGLEEWGSGKIISSAAGVKDYPVIVSDGLNGAIIAWQDSRNGGLDIYAQKVDQYGYLGNVSAVVAGVRDIINDQGGRVNVFWNRSYGDIRGLSGFVTNYLVFRGARGPGAASHATVLSREEFMAKLAQGESVKDLVWTENPAAASPSNIYWEYYGEVVPRQLATYFTTMNTLADSGTQGIYRTYAMVTTVAYGGFGPIYWDSAPDSGYSVDNLPPGAPTAPSGNVQSTTTAQVRWNRNRIDPDVGNYRVYRGTSGSFTPAPSNYVGTTEDSAFTDNGRSGGADYWYRVTTVDQNGNESTPTAAFPAEKIKASLRLYLQGPFNSGAGEMNTTLNTGGYLAAHFAGVAIPSRAVDSVNVELRNNLSASAATVRQFRPAWLLADGTIRGFEDTTRTYVEFDTLGGSYYFVVRHRNHIGVMTAAPQSASYLAPAAPYNFSTAQTQAYGASPMNQIGSTYVLVPGDANTNGQVANSDINAIRAALGQSGYRNGDINLNGQVANSDVVAARSQLGRGSQVPAAPIPAPISEEK